MWPITLVLSVCLAGAPSHPHVPRVLKTGLAQGDLTLTYFTVPFNPAHLTELQPGFSWHAGFARLATTSPLQAGTTLIPAGSYKLNFQKTKDGWALELRSQREQQALAKIRDAKRKNDEELVKSLTAQLEEEKKKGEMFHAVIPFAMAKAEDQEHLRFQVVASGYVAKSMSDPTPAGGAELTIHADFGTLHGRLDLTESLGAETKAPAEKAEKMEKTEKTEKAGSTGK